MREVLARLRADTALFGISIGADFHSTDPSNQQRSAVYPSRLTSRGREVLVNLTVGLHCGGYRVWRHLLGLLLVYNALEEVDRLLVNGPDFLDDRLSLLTNRSKCLVEIGDLFHVFLAFAGDPSHDFVNVAIVLVHVALLVHAALLVLAVVLGVWPTRGFRCNVCYSRTFF